MAAITGPIALYNNPPINPQFFQPWGFTISNISLGATTTVTLTIPSITDLNFVVGQLVRFLIPPTFGCRQLNQQEGYVISIPNSTDVEIDIDSSAFDAYVASSQPTKAQLIPVGDINSGQINASGRVNNITFIPGSFINISPN